MSTKSESLPGPYVTARGCESIKQYVSDGRPTNLVTMGEIVERTSDSKFFFNLSEWTGYEWHPLTVGFQTGLFANAQDLFESWKRMQEVWNNTKANL